MKHFRTDDPHTNPSIRVDSNRRPRRDHRTLRADAADPKRDSADRLRARQDAALADVRGQYKRNRGYTRDDLREAQTKPEAAPKPAMDADAARQAAHDAIRGAARRDK